MSPVGFGDGLEPDLRTKAGSTLREIGERLLGRMSDAGRCSGHGREFELCVYRLGEGRLQVSVKDCCCDYHAQLFRAQAESELEASHEQLQPVLAGVGVPLG